jgi:hypothetical protein
MVIDPAISFSLSIAIAGLLAMGAAHKLSNPVRFFTIVTDYRLAPSALSPVLGAALIAIEAATAVCLLVPASHSAAAGVAALIFCAYGLAIGVNIARGRTEIDCGCHFGAARDGAHLSVWMLVRNGVLAAGALLMSLPVSGRETSMIDLLSIAMFVIGAGVLYATYELLMALPARNR